MSEIKVDTLTGKTTANDITVTVGATATMSLEQGLAKAWNHFDGTGTIAIDNSFNVSSLTDTTTGQYASNFTSNMSAADYPNTGHSRHDGGVNALFSTSNKDNNPPSTTKCGIDSFSSDGNQVGTDSDFMSQVIHGDLA